MIHSAMTIASAVPQLIGGGSGSGSTHSSANNIPAKLSALAELKPPFRQISVSAENINRVTTTKTTTNLAVSFDDRENQENVVSTSETTTMTATSASTEIVKGSNDTKFPIETYAGLDEAMAEKVKRFEDETKAMLKRGKAGGVDPTAMTGETKIHFKVEAFPGTDL